MFSGRLSNSLNFSQKLHFKVLTSQVYNAIMFTEVENTSFFKQTNFTYKLLLSY